MPGHRAKNHRTQLRGTTNQENVHAGSRNAHRNASIDAQSRRRGCRSLAHCSSTTGVGDSTATRPTADAQAAATICRRTAPWCRRGVQPTADLRVRRASVFACHGRIASSPSAIPTREPTVVTVYYEVFIPSQTGLRHAADPATASLLVASLAAIVTTLAARRCSKTLGGRARTLRPLGARSPRHCARRSPTVVLTTRLQDPLTRATWRRASLRRSTAWSSGSKNASSARRALARTSATSSARR